MKTIKIMPCLDMKNGRVVKGVHFVDIKDAGDPVGNAEMDVAVVQPVHVAVFAPEYPKV